MQILCDADGTLFTHDYPEIGEDIGAAPVLRDLVNKGHKLILNTMRSDQPGRRQYLTEAVAWFSRNGIELYGIQEDPNQHTWTSSRKAYGQLSLDDINLGIPLITWEFDSDGDGDQDVNLTTSHNHKFVLPNLPIHPRPYVDCGNTEFLLKQKGIL